MSGYSYARCYVFAHNGFAQGGARDCLGSHGQPNAARNHVERVRPVWAQVVRSLLGMIGKMAGWSPAASSVPMTQAWYTPAAAARSSFPG